MSNNDLTAKYEAERLRAHEQSQLVYLQGQIDELRRQLKDQSNKYAWAMEQSRKTEASVVQVQSLFERHAEEVTQSGELLRRDTATLRKEIAGALVKIEEGVKPLREMQAQIQQVAEARKQDRDYVAGWLGRVEALEQQILVLQSQIKEVDERQRQSVLQFDRLREADAAVVQDVRRLGDELQVEKQALRRQAVEAQQLVADVQSTIDAHSSQIRRLDEIRQQIDLFAESLPKQLQEVAARLPDMIAETKRVERISTERFLMNQERLEELRQQSDEKMSALQEADEQHLRQLTAWLERIDGWIRELEQRLSRASSRIDAEQKVHTTRIIELERREIASLQAMLELAHDRYERVRAEQLELHGDEEQS
jgi:chromosome segregation ATPase